ncbi:MAG: hypothetical protein JNM93_04400 [Bacteriovoracaceae bacterium]|nr:hypothetical protein [Bacteriovoracaceae bacterium]
MKFILFFTLSSFFSAHAYQLLEVKAVSSSKTTFITRQGKGDGVFVGKKGTFTTDDASFIARAKTVSREFTQWEMVNEEMQVPFQTGELVTYNDAAEYLWTLTPSETRKEYLKKYNYQEKESWLIKAAFSKNLSSSVSNAAPDSEIDRASLGFEGHYEKTLNINFRLNTGLRYEKEVINVDGGQFETYRMMAMLGMTYYFERAKWLGDNLLYTSINVGYGLSGTQTTGFTQRGVVALLPSLKFGVQIPMNELFDFITELGVESLASREKGGAFPDTRTDQINGLLNFGLRRYF